MSWRKIIPWYILSGLAILLPEFCFGADELEMQLREAREARLVLEEENRELRQELSRKEQELAKIRSRYAEMILRSRETLARLERLELQVTHLMGGEKLSLESQQEQSLAETVECLASCRRNLLEIQQELADLEVSFKAMMDIVQPSGAIRQELQDRIAALKKTVESSLKPLSLVTRRGDGSPKTVSCTVRSVEPDGQVVILDRGYLSDLRAGMVLCLVREGLAISEVKVVEAAADRSAAVFIGGNWDVLLPGVELTMKPLDKAANPKKPMKDKNDNNN